MIVALIAFFITAALTTLRLRLLPRNSVLYQVWFGATLGVALVATGTLCFLWHHVLPRFGLAKVKVEELCVLTGWLFFKAHLLSNPQIQVIWRNPADYDSLNDTPEKGIVMLNHMSFFDAFVATSNSPPLITSTTRCYVKDSLLKIPIFGSYFVGCGHFQVYFTAEAVSMAVDKDKQKPVTERVNAHLNGGGRMVMYPEGNVNRTPEKGLQPFRVGGFNTVLEHKSPLVMGVVVGSNEVWPRKAAIGGFPTDVCVSYTPCEVLDGETAPQLADRMQKMMQREYDDLVSWRATHVHQKKTKLF